MLTDYLQTSGAYAIPPILGFLVLISLTLISLLRGGKNPANKLFAGICLTGALVNADMVLVSTIPDKNLTLTVDRVLDFFFVLALPVYIQFIRSSAYRAGDGLYMLPFSSVSFSSFLPHQIFLSADFSITILE